MQIKTYREGEYSQLNAEDGKVLVSIGEDDVRLLRLGFLSLPRETLAVIAAPTDSPRPFWRTSAASTFLKSIVDELLPCNTVPEAIEKFSRFSSSKESKEKNRLIKKYIELAPGLRISDIAKNIGDTVFGDNPIATGAYASGYILRQCEKQFKKRSLAIGNDLLAILRTEETGGWKTVKTVADKVDTDAKKIGISDAQLPYLHLSADEVNAALARLWTSYVEKFSIEDEVARELITRYFMYGYAVGLAEELMHQREKMR